MPTKKELLKNIREYSPEQIADAVRCGEVSIYELIKETGGAFTPLLKKQVKAILDMPIPSANTEPKEESISQEETTLVTGSASTESPIMPEIPIVSLVDATSDPPNPLSSVAETTKPNEDDIGSKPRMFSRPFSFKGRIRRMEYGISMIICLFIDIVRVMMLLFGTNSDLAAGILLLAYFILLIPYCWFAWAQGAKRCHDRGNSGWYQFIPFYCFVLLFGNGEKGTNSYGVSPK